MQRQADVLEYSADRDAELRLAIAAAVEADADTLLSVRLDLRDPARAPALPANRTIGPDDAFEESEGGVFVVEVRAR